MKTILRFLFGAVLGALLVAACSSLKAQPLTTEDRAVIVETLWRVEQTNRLYQFLIPESAQYFKGKADGYAAAREFIATYSAPTQPETANVVASTTDALTQPTPKLKATRPKRVINGRRCL